jgi:hypothetical protein
MEAIIMKRLISIFVSLLAMATFAMVGSAVAGNIPYDPSYEHLIDEEQGTMTRARVGSAVVGNIPYDPSYEHLNDEEQGSMTQRTEPKRDRFYGIQPSWRSNVPYDPS